MESKIKTKLITIILFLSLIFGQAYLKVDEVLAQPLTFDELTSITSSYSNLTFDYLINVNMFSEKSYLYSLDLDLNIQLSNESRQEVVEARSEIENISKVSISELKPNHISLKDIKQSKKIPVKFHLRYYTKRYFPKITQEISYPYFFSNEEKEELSPYLKNTPIINYDSPVIQEKAQELIKGEEDYYSAVVKIAEFTKKNVNYVLTDSTENDIKRASWVLINKEGVCDEITVLFIALLRAAGIPARFVSGIAYTNIDEEKPWGYHSWAEVYFPDYGWVPFDVTFGEFGYLDSLHIVLSRPKYEKTDEISYVWKSRDTNVKIKKTNESFSYKILNQDGFSEIIPRLKAYPEKEETGFPSYNLIKVQLENEYPYYLPIVIEAIIPKGLSLIDNSTKVLVLKPREKKQVSFLVRVPSNLKQDYIYTMPVLFVINGKEFNTSFKVNILSETYSKEFFDSKEKVEKKESIDITCNFNKYIYINETQKVDCKIKNIGSQEITDLICLEESCYNLNLKPSEEKEFSFNYLLTSLGWQAISLKYLNEERLLKVLVLPKPNITINYEVKGKDNEINNKSILLKLKPTVPVKDLKLGLDIKLDDNLLVRIANYSLENLNQSITLLISIDKFFIYNQTNRYLLEINYSDPIKEYQTKKMLEIRLKDLSFKDRIILFFRRILLRLGFI
ncbi:MAG: hypothetical protein PWP03_55 [Candidatus Woesearchaeota archaeon]|nr:hypothetical protein [Candidatus Woesearchaeota archaeon]MDN5327417.1 hypothetical protein [Candidatus Woesearchaeota archaeon]